MKAKNFCFPFLVLLFFWPEASLLLKVSTRRFSVSFSISAVSTVSLVFQLSNLPKNARKCLPKGKKMFSKQQCNLTGVISSFMLFQALFIIEFWWEFHIEPFLFRAFSGNVYLQKDCIFKTLNRKMLKNSIFKHCKKMCCTSNVSLRCRK